MLKRVSRMLVALGTVAVLLPLSTLAAFGMPAQQADRPTPIEVPAVIQVPEGNTLVRIGHAVGTQNYVCLPSDSGVKFVLFTPRATLFSDDGQPLASHYFSPNPSENDTVRATWADLWSTAVVWAKAVQTSSDPNFVAAGAIPWVLLQQAGVQGSSDERGGLSETSYVQRLNTSGGAAPATGCGTAADVGNQAFVPYTADYFFYVADA
jgi:uncharacterized protein DUF3455